ncbi:hypothetical protein M2132_001534 [Dysgonomonas sp. PH5-45]|uniref:hypothetical protein n=1 Tax=unclassified Dysgonomonas TaxID=2630389 RepID=UPI00247EBC0C|nr:hypothetical protein [Dysgonomonas sp. PH5-45]MDH6388077.1 hypothetical protein [Dysgonomonas sp. PH5-37]
MKRILRLTGLSTENNHPYLQFLRLINHENPLSHKTPERKKLKNEAAPFGTTSFVVV